MGVALLQAAEPYPLQARVYPLFAFLPALLSQAESHVVCHGEMRKQGVFLEYHAQAALVGRQLTMGAGDLFALNADGAGGHRFQPGNGTQCGGLATAAGAQQAGNFTGRQFQVQILYDGLLVIAAGQILKAQ